MLGMMDNERVMTLTLTVPVATVPVKFSRAHSPNGNAGKPSIPNLSEMISASALLWATAH